MSLFNKILGKKEQGIKKNEEIKKEDVNDLKMERTNSSASSEENTTTKISSEKSPKENAKMMNITLKINEQQIVIPVARTMDNT